MRLLFLSLASFFGVFVTFGLVYLLFRALGRLFFGVSRAGPGPLDGEFEKECDRAFERRMDRLTQRVSASYKLLLSPDFEPERILSALEEQFQGPTSELLRVAIAREFPAISALPDNEVFTQHLLPALGPEADEKLKGILLTTNSVVRGLTISPSRSDTRVVRALENWQTLELRLRDCLRRGQFRQGLRPEIGAVSALFYLVGKNPGMPIEFSLQGPQPTGWKPGRNGLWVLFSSGEVADRSEFLQHPGIDEKRIWQWWERERSRAVSLGKEATSG